MFLENGDIQNSFHELLSLVLKVSKASLVGAMLLDVDNQKDKQYFFEAGNKDETNETLMGEILSELDFKNAGKGLIVSDGKPGLDRKRLGFDLAYNILEINKGRFLAIGLLNPELAEQEQLKQYVNTALNSLKMILKSRAGLDQRKLFSAISDKKYLLENLFGWSSDIFCVLDKDFNPVYVSPSFSEVLGYSSSSCNKEFFLEKFLIGKEEGDTSFIMENTRERFDLVTKSGKKIWIDTVLSPIKNESGEVDAYLAVSRDVSNEENFKSDQKFALQKERELNNTKSQFVSITSHEFKTPLSTIKSSVEICSIELERNAEDVPSREKFKKHFKRINSEADRMNTLLNNLLNLEKINQGAVQVKLKKKYVRSYLSNVLESYLDHDLIYLDIDLPEDFQVQFDGALIRQSLLNLVENALKYGSRELKPVVKTYLKENELTLCVEDFGEGISEEDKKNLFKPFYRASNSHKYEKGSGLGLMITRKFVELLGGKVSFTSELGKGSTFTIHLPLK